MTIVPLTQASLRLGVDVKTLRGFLAQAQFPLQSDPQDARKKGVGAEHLHLLAHRHQRCLTSASPDLSAPEAASPAPLPPSLLALPQQLSALQTQIAALQQQVADLSLLLQPRSVEPAAPAAPPEKTRTRPGRPAPSIPKTRRAAKTASMPVPVIPRVEYGADGHYVVICPKKGRLPFEPDTPEWFAWVAEQDSFRGCRERWATSPLIMSGASPKGLGGRIAISATTTTSCVWLPTTN